MTELVARGVDALGQQISHAAHLDVTSVAIVGLVRQVGGVDDETSYLVASALRRLSASDGPQGTPASGDFR